MLLLSTTMQRIMKICTLKALPLAWGTLFSVVSENRPENPFGWVWSGFLTWSTHREQHRRVCTRKAKNLPSRVLLCFVGRGVVSVKIFVIQNCMCVCVSVWEGGFCCRFCLGYFSRILLCLVP